MKGSRGLRGTYGEEAARGGLSWSTSPQGGYQDGQHLSRSHKHDSSHQSGAEEERALVVRCFPVEPSLSARSSRHQRIHPI